MKVRHFGIFAVIAGLFCATVSSAQNLPLIEQDPSITSSVFSNGLSCYIVDNEGCKGLVDFALIKRDYDGRELLQSYRGVASSAESVIDSTLLGMMRRVEADGIPADCALIVSGDVDSKSLMTKLKYMALMVDSSSPSMTHDFTWNGDVKVNSSILPVSQKGLSTAHFEWYAPGVPVNYMNTIQTAVYEKAVWELGDLACRWIKRSLKKQDIPYADVSYSYFAGANSQSCDRFELDVTVSDADVIQAQKIVASVLSSIDKSEVHPDDIILAEKEYYLSLDRSADKAVQSNEEYMQMCKDAFLYNRPLSSERQRLAFFRSKDVPQETRSRIFTDIASALVEIDTLPRTLDCPAFGVMLSDTLGLPGTTDQIKVRSSRKDNFSGGTVWTFANGFKVVYIRKPSTNRNLYYSLSLKGGYGNIENLSRGEGAYMSDYLDCCWISGMRGSDFKDVLSFAGMSMDSQVNLFNTVISGQVEDRNATLLMKSLLAVVNESRPDLTMIDYFIRCENLRQSLLSGSDVKAEIDAMMCPGYRYSPFKAECGLTEDTFGKAETLFSTMTSKMNDGLLVLVGDMYESDLKKVLQMYVGGFKSKKVASRKPSMVYHPVSGWTSCEVEGEQDAAYMTVSTPMLMTAVNHFAAEVAVMMLERRIKDVFEAEGKSVRVAYARNIYPEERFSIMVQVSGPCGQKEMAQLRRILSECKADMTDAELKSCKEYVKNIYAQKLNTVEYWLRVVPLRHIEGKDFTTGYGAKIDAISLPVVQSIFEALDKGAGIEYITTKK